MRFVILAAVLLLAMGSSCSAPRRPLPPRPAIWSEYLSAAQVTEALPLLADHGLDLNLAVAKDRWSAAETVAVVREADRLGVRVRFWPLVTFDEGYWACESNVDVVREQVRSLMDLIEREDLPVDTFEMDMEPHFRRVEQLTQLLRAGGGAVEVLSFFQAALDPAAFAGARKEYRALVDEMHARGFRVNMSTVLQVLDDLQDGDNTVQDALDVPVTGIAWDQMSFQVYRTAIQSDFGRLLAEGQALTSDVVFDYAVTAKTSFGDLAALDLGLIQSQGSGFPGYSEAAGLREDIAAALAAGIPATQLQIFALDGLREQPDPGAWISGMESVEPARPLAAQSTRDLRSYFRMLDSL